MASGVGVAQDVLTVFEDLKIGHKHKYIIYKIGNGDKEVVVDKASADGDYDAFLADLPETEPRYAVYDLEFEKEGGGKRSKILFVTWSPDDARIRSKMLYSSSKDALRRALVGVGIEVQATDFSEISHETILDKAKRSGY